MLHGLHREGCVTSSKCDNINYGLRYECAYGCICIFYMLQ